MRKDDRFEQELNVVGAARRAKAFGIKTMTVVVTVAMLVSGVPTRVIAESLQEAGVIAAQDSTDQSASSSGQQTADQAEVQDQSNTQEQSQAASEQADQPSAQDNAAAAQNDSPSAQPAPSAQPSQQTETADIALTLNNASITYKGQVVAQPAQKVTAPTSDSFEFTVQPDNGYELSKVTLTVSGTDRELKADANGLYTVDAADVAQSPRVSLETEQEKAAEPAKEATPIEDAEGVDDESAAADQPEDKKSDEKDVNAVDVAAPADAKQKIYTVEVGGTVEITGQSGIFDTWESDNESIATVDDAGKVTGVGAGTTTIKHTFGLISRSTETFTVQVTPAQPKISGADTVKKGDSTTFTVSGFEQGQTVQWVSADSNIATVDASGQVTGVHVGKTNITAYTANNQSVSKQIEVKRDDSHGGYYVYLYTKAEGDTDGLALKVNSSGWYTIGRVWVKDIAQPRGRSGYATSGTNYDKTIEALCESDNIDLYGVNSIDIKDIDWAKFGLKTDNGANDYVYAGEWTWHLDGYVKFDNSGSLVFHYKDVDTDDPVREDYTTTAKVTGENFDFSSLRFSIDDYTYDHAEPESVKVEKKQTKYVTLYYRKGTYPYTVKYLEAGTNKVLRKEKKGGGKYGSEVTEKAKDIDGYELADSTKQQQSIHLGTGDNVITFYYKKAPTASYTVNYYWNGTKEKVAVSKTVSTGYVGKKVEEAPDDNVKDCTPVSDASKTIELVKDENKNVINFYYYKNVELTAKSDTVTYNGEEQSVSGFTGAPKGADFSEIKVGASGTNAGTYHANFAEGTVGKVDATKKYIVTTATDGELVISPVTNQVVIKVTGHTGGEKYNGKEQIVTGYDVSGLPDGMDKNDITFNGTAEAKGKNAGTYDMGLKASQFSLAGDVAENFTNVTFKVTDGKLTIAQRQIWRITPDGKKNYDGAALVCKGDLNANKYIDPQHESDDDGFVDGEGFAGKDNFTWTEDAVLPGEYDNVVKNISYKNGTEPKNYDVHIAYGKLKINEPSESEKHEITITANSSLNNKYDGKNHTAAGFTTSSLSFTTEYGVVTYRLENVETSNPTKKDAGKYDNTITKNSVKVLDEKGHDVTKLVKLNLVDGKLVIKKRSVTLLSESKKFQYNGKNHSCEKVSVDSNSDGFVEGEGVAYKNFATIKNVGTKANSFDFDWNTAAERNYEITKCCGVLSVTKGDISKYVTLNTVDVSDTYDGNHHVAGEATATDENGNDLKIEYQKSDGTWTTNRNDVYAVNVDDSGIVNVRVSSPANYGEGNYVTGTEKLVVNPVAITLTAKSDSKPYNGIALTNNGYDVTEGKFVGDEGLDSVTVSGSQTEVGKSDNLITAYALKENTKSTNYKIELVKGHLEVIASNAAVVVKIKGNTDSKKYDGTEQSVSGYTVTGVTVDGKDSNLYGAKAGTDFTFNGNATVKRTDAGKTMMGLATTQFDNINRNFSNVTFEVVEDGSMTITKRAVTLTSADHTWPYDGKDHQEKHVSVTSDGFAAGEGVDYGNFATVKDVTTKPVENTFIYTAKKGTNLERNYNVKVVNGKLTVTKAAAAGNIVLTTKDESKTYDGHALEAGEAKATATTGDDIKVEYSADHKTWTENRSEVALTNAGNKTVYVRASSEKNFSGFVEATETLTVDPATLTIATKNAEKPYDGKALTADGSMTGLVNGETAEFKVTGSLTDVGEIANAYTLTWNGTAQESNYTVKETVGKLKVTARPIDDTTYGMSVSKPESVEYDGNAHKWAPTVKDGEKTLVEGTDYTVAYGKDDFTNVTGEIKVTVTGKGNYAGSVERAYQITPAPLTVETEGATKVYDGEALTHDVATIKGLKNKETATIHATGSQTEVGESDNGYAITWDGSAQKDNYTIKTKTIGKLVVSETADQITATPANVETTYDGNAHGTTVQVTGLPKGYTVKKAESKATATDVADGEAKAAVDELVIVNAQGKDVTSKLNIKRGTATIKINPAPLTVTTDGGEKEYDGTALTANGIKVEGLKGKDSVSAKTTGSRTKVGSSNNTYETNWKDTKKSNYKVTDVLGTLKVTPSTKAVTLTSGSASHAYSGHALTSDEIKAEGLPEGFTVKAKMDGAQTDAGSSENTVKSYKILDAKGDDVTDMFANVTVKTGTLTVSPKEITVETEGATKVYDGQELTNKNGAIHGLVSGEHADVVTNGTQTNVGSSENGYTIAWGTAKEGNYTIASDTLGKLIVTPQSVNPNDPSYHKIQVSNPADLTYDGQTHKWAPEVKDYTGTELKEGVDYAIAYDTDDFINAGSITVTVVGKGNYTGTVSRTYRIKPAPVSIKTESAARVYNGKALTAGGAIIGLVNGETVDFRVTGSQTKVGHSANTYKLAWTGTAREANYTVDSIETGTLTVTESEDTVVVTTTGGIFTYDGNAHGATVAVSQLPEGYTVDGTPSSDATATDANGDGVKATVDHLVIRNSEGEDVTSKLNIKKVDGTIKVLPAELTVTTDSATKVYDGTALTAGATVTGLVGDEEATLEATGNQTQVGSSSNGYKLTFDKTAKDRNYKVVSENLGTLTVTKQSIVPSEPGTPSDNYKGVTVDDPKDAVYDGVEHKWTPVVKDTDGNELKEGVDYEVTYGTDDFADVATINATITGKGNYAGAVTKSYRITKAPLHIVTGSATKTFDGTALTNVAVTVDGLAQTDRIGVTVTGQQTGVGSSQNTYTIDWMQVNENNYELTDELGTLTVTPVPATPQNPVTPGTTPTTPGATPGTAGGNNVVNTVATALANGYNAVTGNNQGAAASEEQIFDAKNPLGRFDGQKDTCWVHWYMIVCGIVTAVYGLFVGLRRNKHSRRLEEDLNKVLGDDDESQE